MVKASAKGGKASVKSKKTKSSSHGLITNQEKPPSKVELPPVEEKDLNEITLVIESYQHIVREKCVL
ncbi:hypothetical protein MTP99_012092 [Tenebrio molitor]|nr:hypothetical protein MTP99_012092 [Tenebrio molitor]